ncbi:unnamed protein product [Zymoseptoria tritici ST99CH_3D1]|uniref:Uncharacterized protein n=1 Tax=Zymoseptoria tritici (strain ST99CH_3D7) TaxID=1276538 RepID=A0A1X7RV82_ZYMT9|nr:unnamed protein product [Zymoseptoria tritici ST99CH_3D7]SMR54919.1 unnamed protein product [Zymoseptoria tritici ST99CH_3D1]
MNTRITRSVTAKEVTAREQVEAELERSYRAAEGELTKKHKAYLDKTFKSGATLGMRLKFVGIVVREGATRDVYARVNRDNGLHFLVKDPSSGRKFTLVSNGQVTFVDTPFDMPKVAAELKREEKCIAGLELLAMNGGIGRTEMDLCLKSPKVRYKTYSLASLRGHINSVKDIPSLAKSPTARHQLEQDWKDGRELLEKLGEKFSVPAEYMDCFKVLCAIGATWICANIHTFTKHYSFFKLVEHADFVVWSFFDHYFDAEEVSINLSLLAEKNITAFFNKAACNKNKGNKKTAIITDASAIRKCAVASLIAGTIWTEDKDVLQSTDYIPLPIPKKRPDSCPPIAPMRRLVAPGSRNELYKHNPTHILWVRHFLESGQWDLEVSTSPLLSNALDTSKLSGQNKIDVEREFHRLRKAMRNYSEWQLVRMVIDQGVVPAANRGDIGSILSLAHDLRVMVAGHKPDMITQQGCFNETAAMQKVMTKRRVRFNKEELPEATVDGIIVSDD